MSDPHQGSAHMWLDMTPEWQEAIQRAAHLCLGRLHVRTGPNDAPDQLWSDAWCNLQHNIASGSHCHSNKSEHIIPRCRHELSGSLLHTAGCLLAATSWAMPAAGSCSSAPDPPQFQRQPLVAGGPGSGPLAEPALKPAPSDAGPLRACDRAHKATCHERDGNTEHWLPDAGPWASAGPSPY